MERAGDSEEQLVDEENCKNDKQTRDETTEYRAEEVEVIEHEESDDPQSKWAVLPDVCLRKVFWWLCDRDRVRAALVCHHWRHVIRYPSLWRQRRFCFSGRGSRSRRSEADVAVDYLKAYGRYMEELELRFSHPLNSLVSRRFQQAMCTFLAALRKVRSSLRSLTILHMHLDSSAWCHSVRSALVQSLTFYLQHEGWRLSYLCLRGARFSLPQGLEVLESMAAAQQHIRLSCRPSLMTLNLEDFFTQTLAVYSTPDFAKIMCQFSGLSSLTLNYSCVSDDLLQALASSCVGLNGAGSLCSFTVHCHVHEPHVQVIWGDAWARLAQRCPALKVQMSVEQILTIGRLSRILLREIPMHSLSLTSCYFGELNWTIKPVLTSLVPWYRICLQKLALDINNTHETMDEELLEVVTVCSNLTYLKVRAFLKISFLERLLQKRLDRKCALNTIKVRLCISKRETYEEDEKLKELFSRYRQLIDSELNYSAITHLAL